MPIDLMSCLFAHRGGMNLSSQASFHGYWRESGLSLRENNPIRAS